MVQSLELVFWLNKMDAVVFLVMTINVALSFQYSEHYVFVFPSDTAAKTYNEAQNYCKEMFDTDLATIKSWDQRARYNEVEKFVINKFNDWIGIYFNDDWADGGGNSTSVWVMRRGQHCHMGKYFNSHWDDGGCSRKEAFICNS